MILSENLYFLILFTLPAAINIIYNTHIRYVPKSYKDKSVELAECIFFCLNVFIINVLILKDKVRLFFEYLLLKESDVQAFIEKTKFDYLDFMIQYFLINLLTSIVVICIWNWVLKKMYLLGNNKINKLIGRAEEAKYGDVWRNIFEEKELIDVNNHAVLIEKNGQMVTTGLIGMYQAPNEEQKEIVVYNTERIKELLEEDKIKQYENRVFKDSVYEYYNISEDVLIKFYSLEEYDKLVEK